MAATDMKLAGLEEGCKVTYLGHEKTVMRISPVEPAILCKDGNPPKWGGTTAWLYSDEVMRDYEDAQKARHARLYQLIDHYPHHLGHVTESDTIERYCGIQQEGHDGDFGSCLADSFEDVAEILADEFMNGWTPEAVFDLDTGERIEIHVSTPIVSRSEDQGTMENVLEGLEIA